MLRQNYLKLSLIILGIAVLISFLIIRSSSHSSPKITIDNPKPITNSVAQAFSLEQNNQKLTPDIENLKISDENNLTLKVADELAQQILQLNEDNDLSSGKLQVPNEELFSEAMIEKYKSYFLQNLSFTKLDELNFGPDNPPFTSFKYFVEVFQIIYNRKITDDILDAGLQNFIDSENPEFIKDMIDKLDGAIADFKKLPIPSSFADLHLDLINLFNARRAILATLYNYQKDPISTLAASQLFDELDNHYLDWMKRVVEKMKSDGSINYFRF